MQAAVMSARLTMNDEIKAGKRTGTDVVACEALFEEWKPGKYEKDDVRVHDGQVWRCCQPHDNKNNPDIEPGKSPAQWVPYHTTDPQKAKPFIQPTMAEDSYQKGEVCLWTDGKVYRSTMEPQTPIPPQTIRRAGKLWTWSKRTPRREPVPRRGHSITGGKGT